MTSNREGKAVNKETIGKAKKRIRPPSELTNIALFASSQASTVIRKQRKLKCLFLNKIKGQ